MKTILFLLMLSGCASPKVWVIKENATGGVIGHDDHAGNSRQHLSAEIKHHVRCPDSYRVVAEKQKTGVGKRANQVWQEITYECTGGTREVSSVRQRDKAHENRRTINGWR